MARAISFNHSIRAKALEASLARARTLAAGGAMLPDILAKTDHFLRDRPHASRSSGSTVFSSSSDIAGFSRDVTLSWNVLDFGLSIVRMRQGLDRVHQQKEELRRVSGRIAEETRGAFWKSVALQKLEAELRALGSDVDRAIATANEHHRDRRIDPMVSINFLKDILNLQRELNQLETAIGGALDQLVQLTGLASKSGVRLDASPFERREAGPLSDAAEDVRIALLQRPEIRQHMYDIRITADEAEATLLQVLPGLTFSRSFASDSNSHLLHSQWVSAGTTLVGNVMNLVRLDDDLAVAETQARVHRQSALATAAMIVMQVHVARARIGVQRRAFDDAMRFAAVQRQLLHQVRAAAIAGKTGEQAVTREKLATLLAEVRAILAYSELQSAIAAHASARGDDAVANEWVTELQVPDQIAAGSEH